jgi:hypothetical protein
MPRARRSDLPDASLLARLGALALGATLLLVGCAEASRGTQAGAMTSPAGASPLAEAMSSALPRASGDPGATLCQHVAAVDERLAAVQAVELRLPNRVALDIELAKLQAAYGALRQADLGPFADQLEAPLKRLGNRLIELELAVEDFRTNSRPQQAVAHVETDALTFGDELAAFAILSRC